MKLLNILRPRNEIIEMLTHPRLWSGQQRVLALLAVPIVATLVTFAAVGAGSPPAYRSIALASDPLYATTSGDKPALALALSVEYPTVGAQYVRDPGDSSDDSYSNTNEYLGYYDAEACYTYNNAPTGPFATGMTAADYKRFDRSAAATDRKCTNEFSGNFLNWASSSAIDMLRLALSGGDRYVDTPDITILQRAVIPNGDPICMWNSSNFPAKRLRRNGGSSGSAYFGAVPNAMTTQAGGSDIWVANTLNRIHFGTSNTGNCYDTSAYTLGGAPPTSVTGPVTNFNGPKPNTVSPIACASENGNCTLAGTQEVWYGANTSWAVAPATGTISCSNNVFGDPISGVAKQCFLGPYNGTWTPPSTGGTALNSEGFFYSRVQVCNSTGGVLADVRDYNLCTKYSNGNFKPTGVVQKYSDQLRLSAFGYLLDQTASYNNGRYGGVLRAPMKYVGTKTFDINGQENTPGTGNANAEWDAATGVFKTNPDNNATFGISGVVNYLNKFGRTGPTPGRYKIYDPISELYYETLRYLQGLQPSPDAVSNIVSGMEDGFPVYTTWTDPYGEGRTSDGKYGCLKSNIVVIGDINTHDNNGNRWPAANPANNIPNLGYWNGIVGSYENGSVTGYLDGQGTQQYTSHPSTTSATNGGPRLDGIVGYSYWAHTHDIRGTDWTSDVAKQRPGLRVKTFTFDVNEYGDQSNNNTRRYRNQLFTAAKYGGFESDPSNADSKPYNTFGNPYRRQDGTVDDNVWQDTARPGEAGAYYLQSSARGVLKAFDSIFSRAATSARSIAGSAIQSKALTQAGSTIYQGAFDTSNWSGDLLALPVTVDASNNVTLGTTPNWSAASKLTALASPAATRNISIGNAGGAAVPSAYNFEYGSLPSSLQADLDRPAPAAASDGLGADRVAYLRGSNAKDGAGFRQRNNKLLGDIINSGVAYSGTPSTTITSATYPGFVTSVASRTPAVFVGANDGMMHAFNAETGDELFGYIPSWLSPKLSALTATTYIANHQSYVDGPPVVTEAQVGSAGTSADWKTVLVSGTGAGGRGVFALDVTRPESFTAANAMWEFTSADDADLGYVVGQPQVLKLRTSASGATATYKWYAVVASGVDNYLSDSVGNFSATGNPAIFLLDLAKPTGAGWVLGSNYFKISLPVNAALSATTAPGVVNFKAALGSAGEVTYIFAGDLQGNLWKFDFRSAGTANWNMAGVSAFMNGITAYPLYIAKDGTGKVQPISMAPSLIAGETAGTIYIAFGTGKYLEANDRSSTESNSFYVINDNGSATADGGAPGISVISGRGRLAVGAVNTTTGIVDVPAFVWGRASSDNDAMQRSGYYFDYLASGERQISGASLAGNTLVFGSLIPGSTGGVNVCGVTGGSGNEYRLNVDTGDGNFRISTVGILGQPLVTEIASATTYTKTDSTGRRVKTIVSQVFNQGSGGIAASAKETTTTYAGRLSWRQINNYQDLKQ